MRTLSSLFPSLPVFTTFCLSSNRFNLPLSPLVSFFLSRPSSLLQVCLAFQSWRPDRTNLRISNPCRCPQAQEALVHAPVQYLYMKSLCERWISWIKKWISECIAWCVARRSVSLFYLFGSVNRWFREKEVRYFISPSFVRVYMLTGASSPEISVPTSFTGARAADEVHSAALESVKGKRYRRRRESNRLLELMRTSLCSALLFESSVHTAAQINHNYSTCSKEMPASVKKGRLFVCLSFCLPVLFAFSSGSREKRKRMDD